MTSTLTPAAASMRAVVKTRPGQDGVVLRQEPVRQVVPGAARLRVLAAGICGTDVHIARDEYPSEPPVIMGHEVSRRGDRGRR